jgi:hypothetical protein
LGNLRFERFDFSAVMVHQESHQQHNCQDQLRNQRFQPGINSEDLDHIVFRYKGSKGTFNGLTGYGSTTANQSVNVSASSEDSQYEFYLIPRDEEDMIDITMMAYDSQIRLLGGCSIDGVPLKRNSITICKGNLFDDSERSASVFVTVTVDDSWGENIVINF